MLQIHKNHPVLATENDIGKHRQKLVESLERWWGTCLGSHPSLDEHVLREQRKEACDALVLLPSSFSAKDRSGVYTTEVSNEEVELRKGEAFDSLLSLQWTVRLICSMQKENEVNRKGVKESTRFQTKMTNLQYVQARQMGSYDAARDALISLGHVVTGDPHSPFPPLSLSDLKLAPVSRKRQSGGSRHVDGKIFGSYGGSSASRGGGVAAEKIVGTVAKDDKGNREMKIELRILVSFVSMILRVVHVLTRQCAQFRSLVQHKVKDVEVRILL